MLDLVTRLQLGSWRLRDRLRTCGRDEKGQTSSEYMLIAGIVVIIIIAILGIFRTQLTDAANTIMGKLTGEVSK
jgi:Flp pilus assembly pilin Flp